MHPSQPELVLANAICQGKVGSLLFLLVNAEASFYVQYTA